MRKSYYNHYIERNGISYFYNSLTNSFFKLPATIGIKIKNILNKENFDDIPKSFYGKLIDGGFIIPDDFDELAFIKFKHNESKYSKHAQLIILPTLDCNYSCWYCIQDHIDSSMSQESVNSIKTSIKKLIEETHIKSLRIDWFGGEPLMKFEEIIYPISKFAFDICAQNNIPFINSATTNGHFMDSRMINSLKEINLNSFQITIDGNKDNHNKVKNMPGVISAFDDTLNNITHLLSSYSSSKVYLRINYSHSSFNEDIIEDICNAIPVALRKRVTILPKKIWQINPNKSFGKVLTKIIQSFKAKGFKVETWLPVTEFLNCYTNRKYCFTITPSGFLAKCTASKDIYNNESIGTIMPSGDLIYNEEYESKYLKSTFENEDCLKCRLLPCCMGNCPRDNGKAKNKCRFSEYDFTFEECIVEYIENYYDCLEVDNI